MKIVEIKKVFNNFIMPLTLMIIRFQVEYLFRFNYRQFFENKGPNGSSDYAGNGIKLPDG